jgi:hypothetical protein
MSDNDATLEVPGDTDDLDAFETGFFGQKSVETTPTKVEAEQEEDTETEEVVETQTDEEDEAELQEEVKEAPKKKTVQDRIDELVKQREELRRESAAELAKLRAEVEALRKPPEQQVTANSAKEADEPKPDALDKDGNPVYGLGEFDPQYIRDLTRFTLNQERAKANVEQAEAQRRAVVEQEQQALTQSWNGKLIEATKEYPDLVEKGQALLRNFETLDSNYAGYLSTLLMGMDKGPDVLYYLSNHPDEATQIVNSGAQKATLALGRIEARFLQSEKEAPRPKISKAPTPPPRNAQARGTNGAFVAVSPDTDDLDSFETEFFKPTRYK